MLFTCLISFPLFSPTLLQCTSNISRCNHCFWWIHSISLSHIPVALWWKEISTQNLVLFVWNRNKSCKYRFNLSALFLECDAIFGVFILFWYSYSVYLSLVISFHSSSGYNAKINSTPEIFFLSDKLPLNAFKWRRKKNIFHIFSHFILRSNYPFHSRWWWCCCCCCCCSHPSVTMYDVNLSQLLISYKLHLWLKIAMKRWQ